MIIIDSPFHITFSSSCKNPTYACVSMCKKCFWDEDLESRGSKSICPQCKGKLAKASESVHFKVLETNNKDIEMSDIRKFNKLMSEQEEELMEKWLSKKVKIMHLSMVKEKFVEKAKKEWC